LISSGLCRGKGLFIVPLTIHTRFHAVIKYEYGNPNESIPNQNDVARLYLSRLSVLFTVICHRPSRTSKKKADSEWRNLWQCWRPSKDSFRASGGACVCVCTCIVCIIMRKGLPVLNSSRLITSCAVGHPMLPVTKGISAAGRPERPPKEKKSRKKRHCCCWVSKRGRA
jgi:hypothetical protein